MGGVVGEPEVGDAVEGGGGGEGDLDDGFVRLVFRIGFLADAVDDGTGGSAFVVEVGFEAIDAVVAESGDIDVAAGDDDGGGERQGAEGEDEGGGE